MPRLRTTSVLIAAAAAVAVSAPTAQAASPTSYVLPGQDVFPEGITSHGQDFYVTSTTDGTVFAGKANRADTRVLSPGGTAGRDAAVGLDVTRNGKYLVVASGAQGLVSVLDARTGAVLRTFSDGGGATFLNDVAIAKNGDAYITDSVSPVLYRIPAAQIGTPGPLGAALQPKVDFTGTAFTYVDGFNANGIVITAEGRYAVIVQSATGLLFRVDLATNAVSAVDLGGVTLTSGDGLELVGGKDLYVVRNSLETIAHVRLSNDAAAGEVVRQTNLSYLMYPTTVAQVGGQLLAVNSQFDQRGGDPVEPFTVGAVDLQTVR